MCSFPVVLTRVKLPSAMGSDVGLWHVTDVTPAATRAAAIKDAADIPARSPFKMSYTQSTFM